jgi:hypothetical protein
MAERELSPWLGYGTEMDQSFVLAFLMHHRLYGTSGTPNKYGSLEVKRCAIRYFFLREGLENPTNFPRASMLMRTFKRHDDPFAKKHPVTREMMVAMEEYTDSVSRGEILDGRWGFIRKLITKIIRYFDHRPPRFLKGKASCK